MEVLLRKGVNAVDMNTPISSDELMHHGVKGQKWGVRRFQNKDGSLTPEGIKRYGDKDDSPSSKDIRVEKAAKKYLNEDGSLTNDAKQKFNTKENMMNTLRKEDDLNNLRSASELNNGAKQIAESRKRSASEKRRQEQAALDEELKTLLRDKASGMSDTELRDIANRLELENRYVRAVSERERVELGRSKAEKFYDLGVNALMITGMALGIAVKIRQLQA